MEDISPDRAEAGSQWRSQMFAHISVQISGLLVGQKVFFFWLRWVFVAARRLFSSCGEQGLLLVVVCGLLIAVASLVAEHRLQVRGLQQLWHAGSVVVAHGLQSKGSVVLVHGFSCSVACGIFPDQGLNLCALHWQADSQSLRHQGSPKRVLICVFKLPPREAVSQQSMRVATSLPSLVTLDLIPRYPVRS